MALLATLLFAVLALASAEHHNLRHIFCNGIRRADVLPVAKQCWAKAPHLVTVPLAICKAENGERTTDDFELLDKCCAKPELFKSMHSCVTREISKVLLETYGDDEKVMEFAECASEIVETIEEGKHYPTTLSPIQEEKKGNEEYVAEERPYICKVLSKPGELKKLLQCTNDLPHMVTIPQRICKAEIHKSTLSRRQMAHTLCRDENKGLFIQYGACLMDELIHHMEHFAGEEEKEGKVMDCALEFMEKVSTERELEKKKEEESAENEI